MDRAAQPAEPEPTEPGESVESGIEPPEEPPEPPVAEAEPPKRRSPAAVLIAIVLLWLLAAAAAWVAAVSTVATSFEVTARYSGPWSPLEFVEPLLIAAVAVLCGLLAIKLRSGRDWARRVVVIVSAIVLAVALLTRAGLMAGIGVVGTVMFALLLVLLLLRPARDWCDSDAPRHSPKIETAAHPPHQVVAALLLLWTAAATALYLGSIGILELAGEEADLASEGAAWAAGAGIVLAIVHGALNIGFSYHRNWARWATVGLAAAYGVWLIVAAILDLFGDGTDSWLMLAVLCLIPITLIWSMAGADSREWCHRAAPGNQGKDED